MRRCLSLRIVPRRPNSLEHTRVGIEQVSDRLAGDDRQLGGLKRH